MNLKSPLQPIWSNHLIFCYQEPWRYYHNPMHIEYMFNAYDYFYNEVPAIYESIAILYHDAVYKPESSTNEKDSISLMWGDYNQIFNYLFRSKIAEEDVEKAELCIEASGHHNKTGFNFEPYVDRFLDCDLAILGADSELYQSYADNVRKEYKMYSDQEYYAGRIKFLETMLKRSNIFLTREAFNDRELQSRDNLKTELQQCQQKLIDLS